MGFSCGIVGLPNVGKSTLFNAITQSSVDASNYPFCTIEPNKGTVSVPDDRLDFLAESNKSKKKLSAVVEFVDIAGLVKGASKGEGLGNKFLSHIREVKAIVQVVRLFREKDVTHIGDVDPMRDLDIINTELMIADMESIEKKIQGLKKLSRSKDKEALETIEILEILQEHLDKSKMLNTLSMNDFTESQIKIISQQNLITIKPMLIVGNVSENGINKYKDDTHYLELKKYADKEGYPLVILSARLEHDISLLETDEEKEEYMNMMEMDKRGLDGLIVEGYRLLDLITFFTSGETESRAWTLKRGWLAPDAAGEIHTDFKRGFIKAETISYDDFEELKTLSACREKGKLRLEGKSYVVQDGDIFVFKFNV